MAELMWIVPNSFVAPLFSKVAKANTVYSSSITLTTCRWSFLFLIILSVFGILLGEKFIILLYGVEFMPSYDSYIYLLPGVCLFPYFKLLTVDLAARGFPGYGAIASGLALIMNVLFNIILIPIYGGKGAAISTSISYVLMALLATMFYLKVTNEKFSSFFLIEKTELIYVYARIKFTLFQYLK